MKYIRRYKLISDALGSSTAYAPNVTYVREASNKIVYSDFGLDKQIQFKNDGTYVYSEERSQEDRHCTSITIAQTEIMLMNTGTNTYQIIPVVLPDDCVDPVTYSSSIQSVATVSSTGLVTLVSLGQTNITIACGTKFVTLAVKCNGIIKTESTVSNITQSAEDVDAATTAMTLSFIAVTTNTYMYGSPETTTKSEAVTIEFDQNLTNSNRQISGVYQYNDDQISYSLLQRNVVMPSYTEGLTFYYATQPTINKTTEIETISGNTIFKLRDSNSYTQYMLADMTTQYAQKYDFIYIPANTQTLRFTWNVLGSWVYGLNIFRQDFTRVYDSGYKTTGSYEVDLSSYNEGLWMGGNFKWTTSGNHEKTVSITLFDLNPELELECEDVYEKISSSIPAATSNSVPLQGAAIYDGKLYQFYKGAGGIYAYDLNDLSATPTRYSAVDTLLHYGSVSFSNITTYGDTVTTIPLVFATGHYGDADSSKYEIVDVIDIENGVLVKQYKFPNRYDDCIAAYDFTNSKMWLIGYETSSGYATTTWYIDEYDLIGMELQSSTAFDLVKSYYITGTEHHTLQDAFYENGNVYILTGWGQQGQKGTIFRLNTTTREINGFIEIDDAREFEGLATDGQYMYATRANALYKVKHLFDATTTTKTTIIEVTPSSIQELKDKGCAYIETALAYYPRLMNVINGAEGILLNGAGYFLTPQIPLYTDTVGAKFSTLSSIASNAKTLWCSRHNNALAQTSFIINTAIRADMGTKMATGQFNLTINNVYEYKQTPSTGVVSLNGDSKTVTGYAEYAPVGKLSIGASYAAVNTDTGDPVSSTSYSNYMKNVVMHTVYDMGDDGMYKMYYVAVADNTMIDIVSGNVITNKTSTKQEYVTDKNNVTLA